MNIQRGINQLLTTYAGGGKLMEQNKVQKLSGQLKEQTELKQKYRAQVREDVKVNKQLMSEVADWKKRAESLIQQKQKRRNFMEALKNMPVTIGGQSGLVGSLPESVQKQIAAQYSKPSQRKKVMDQYYKRK